MIAHWPQLAVSSINGFFRKARRAIHALILGSAPLDPGIAEFHRIIRKQRLTQPGTFDFKSRPETSCRDFELLCQSLADARAKALEPFVPLDDEYLQAAINFIEFQGDIATDLFFRDGRHELAATMARASSRLRLAVDRAPSPRALGLALSCASSTDPESHAIDWAADLSSSIKNLPSRLHTRLGSADEHWAFLCERIALLGARTALRRLAPHGSMLFQLNPPQSCEATWRCAVSLTWPEEPIHAHQRAAILDLICNSPEDFAWAHDLPETAFSSWPEFMAARLTFFMRKIDASDHVAAIISEAISPACRTALDRAIASPKPTLNRPSIRL